MKGLGPTRLTGDGSNTIDELSLMDLILMNLIAYRRGGRKIHTEAPKNDAATDVFVRVPKRSTSGGLWPFAYLDHFSLEEILR